MTSAIVSRAQSLMAAALDRDRSESERAERMAEILEMLSDIATD